jgi:hypothetical protein
MSRAGKSNIDYSKWDRMNFSDSERSDSSDDENDTGPCRVTRLDQPGRVTILPSGEVNVSVNVEETSSSSATTSILSSSAEPAKIGATLPPSSTPRTTKTAATDASAATPKPPASWTSKGGFVEASNLYWSQDRYTVVLRFQLPVADADADVDAADVASSKAKQAQAAGVLPWDCHVTGILPYHQRHAAVQSPTTDYCATLVIIDNSTNSTNTTTGTGTPAEYFRDHVAYPIHAAAQDDNDPDDDDDDDDKYLTDWSIETWPANSLNKYLIVTLNKATPVPNMTIWWRRPVRSCPEIDLTDDHASTSTSTNTNTFAAAWEQAHAQFLQGRTNQEQKRVEVDIGNDDDDDDET